MYFPDPTVLWKLS